MNSYQISRASRLYRKADAGRWQVAAIAYKTVGARKINATKELSVAIRRSVDTVEQLARAYRMFVILCHEDFRKTRNLRRRCSWGRFAALFNMFTEFEFSVDEAFDWLENFDGKTSAMIAEIENKHGAPEWERRANNIYRMAVKLKTDYGVPGSLQYAATQFVKEFDEWSTTQ